jgi:uncharacterized protein (DUF427 family)
MTKFIETIKDDGTVEYVAENIEELMALAEEAAAKQVKIEFTEEQLAETILYQQKHEAREYLKSTDWYAHRLAETQKAIPQDILEKRAAARLLLST